MNRSIFGRWWGIVVWSWSNIVPSDTLLIDGESSGMCYAYICMYMCVYIFVGKYFSRVTFENNIFRDWKSLKLRKILKRVSNRCEKKKMKINSVSHTRSNQMARKEIENWIPRYINANFNNIHLYTWKSQWKLCHDVLLCSPSPVPRRKRSFPSKTLSCFPSSLNDCRRLCTRIRTSTMPYIHTRLPRLIAQHLLHRGACEQWDR